METNSNIIKNEKLISKKIIKKIIAVLFIVVSVGVFMKNNYFLYKSSIATIIDIVEVKTETGTLINGSHEYEETYYKQKITALIRNNENCGKTVVLENHYGESQVYDICYKVGDDVFISGISKSEGKLIGKIEGAKRDFYVVGVLTVFLILIFLIGGKEGRLTLLSLGLNLICFYFVLSLYLKGHNLLFLTIPMVVLFSVLLLIFMYGINYKTRLAFVGIVISVGITGLIGYFAMIFSPKIDYNFMEYLAQPYEDFDAKMLFLSEIIVGTLGAVTDVVVTIVITADQLKRPTFQSLRRVGDDLISTMLPIIFFTNMASAVPFFILSMRNGIEFPTIIKYNIFFEITRFLTGSIGMVLSIPVSVAICLTYFSYYKKHRRVAK